MVEQDQELSWTEQFRKQFGHSPNVTSHADEPPASQLISWLQSNEYARRRLGSPATHQAWEHEISIVRDEAYSDGLTNDVVNADPARAFSMAVRTEARRQWDFMFPEEDYPEWLK